MAKRKLVVIGGGSAYTPEIFSEVIRRNEILQLEEIQLVDTKAGVEHASIILEFGKRMLKAAGLLCSVSLSSNRREALKGADFVISQIRVGGKNARSTDEHLSISLGLLGQETTGAGGFINAMRTIPVALDIAKDMEEICPNAWLINFTNPAGLVTEAILKYTKVNCIGLCNVPINMQADAAKILDVDVNSVKCTVVGLNHLSFVTSVKVKNQEYIATVIEQIDGNETLMKNIPKVEGVGALVETIKVLPSPYLQYYYFHEAMCKKQLNELAETGQTRGDLVSAIDTQMFELYQDEDLIQSPEELSQRGGSLYSRAAIDIIVALLSDSPYELTVNVQNNDAIANLLPTDVVETNCLINKEGIKYIAQGELPETVNGLVQSVKQYERLTVEAAVKKDSKLAVKALLNHPLILDFEKAVAVVEAMKTNYPQYIQLD
jgi:Alpha-galactosidases/6-phospho-beta-glucosidases, family 4 of glycosyl hydrolases